jgi:hypothetical protein
MALARPRREDHQDAGTAVRRDRAPFVGVEGEEAAGTALDGLPARLDADSTGEHGYKCVFLDLVLPEALPGFENDKNRACSFVRPKYDGRSAATGRFDRLQVPVLHHGDPKARKGRR